MEEFYTGTGGFSKIKKSGKALLEDEDFQEEEVWAVMKERGSSSLKLKLAKDPFPSPASACRVPNHQSSAPFNIPDRSKIYSKKSNTGNDDAWAHAADDHDRDGNKAYISESITDLLDDDDEDSNEMIPPHEFIARRLARSPVVSFSMCEGVGRTLKGRDLSRLRNAILTKTGFLE